MKQLVAGVDIGGTNSVLGLVDREGKMYGESIIHTKDFPDFNKYAEEFHSRINQLLSQIDEPHQLLGIGVGAPNGNHYKGTIEYAANIVWKGVIPFVETLQRYFPSIPIQITNDANAAAIGEMIYGAARGMKDFVVITLGTGVGSGFVANGQLIYGHDSFAGELGHIIVSKNGRDCGCGRKGCLETYASATGMKRTIFKLLADHMEDNMFKQISFNDLDASMITEAALKGDPIAIEAFEHTGLMLGQALANIVTITSPEAIILFGGLTKAGGYIFEPTKRHMEEQLLGVFKNKVKLLPSGVTDKNAALLGASALIWQYLENKH